jgi:hypothetical protein
MAADKTTKRRQAQAGPQARPGKAAKTEAGGGASMLRLRTDPRKEWRYEPVASAAAWISVLGMSIGSVLLGAGVYGQWLRGSFRTDVTDPHPYAPYLLLGGALVVAAIALFGPRAVKPIRVGDAGIALEKEPGELDRIGWRDVTRILLSGDVLTFQGAGSVLSIPLKQHPQAAARAVAEARERIPEKLEDVDVTAVPKLDDDAGEVLPLERAQLAGARCKASDELIAFEKDARLCGRCGEVYHKAHVPERCLTCKAPLK